MITGNNFNQGPEAFISLDYRNGTLIQQEDYTGVLLLGGRYIPMYFDKNTKKVSLTFLSLIRQKSEEAAQQFAREEAKEKRISYKSELREYETPIVTLARRKTDRVLCLVYLYPDKIEKTSISGTDQKKIEKAQKMALQQNYHFNLPVGVQFEEK